MCCCLKKVDDLESELVSYWKILGYTGMMLRSDYPDCSWLPSSLYLIYIYIYVYAYDWKMSYIVCAYVSVLFVITRNDSNPRFQVWLS